MSPTTLPEALSKKELILSGVVPFSSVDFPGALAAVLFCQGCPWVCRYCHNPHLRPFKPAEENPLLTRESFLTPLTSWTWKRAIDFLQSRIGFLDSVVFSGGEPTAQSALPSAITEVKAMGYRIGLHTSGAYPGRLDKILPLVDWVGLDIKAPLDDRYDLVTGAEGSGETVLTSLRKIMASGLDYQLRTTVHPSLHSPEDLADLHLQLQELAAPPTVIQQFRIQGCIDAELIASMAESR